MKLQRFRDWSIKYKLLFSHSLTAFIPAALFLVLFVLIIKSNLSYIEKDHARQELNQAHNLLGEKMNVLRALTLDYALWDETYDYINSPNEGYETESIDWIHASQGGALVVFADEEARVVSSRGDFEEFPVGADLSSTSLWRLVYGAGADSYVCVGYTATSQGPFRVAVSQILRSDESGPPRGLMAIGEPLQRSRGFELESLLGSGVSFEPILDRASVFSAELKPLNEKEFQARDTLYALDGSPLVNMILTIDRGIFRSVEHDLMIVYLVMIGAALILVPNLSALLSSSLRTRIAGLRDSMHRLVSKQDYTERLEVVEKDELGDLTLNFNIMLEDLQKTQSDLKGRNSWLKRLIRQKERLMAVLSYDVHSPLSGMAPLLKPITEKDALSEEDRKNLRMVQEESERIFRLLGDVLETNRLEEGDLFFAKKPYPIKALLSESLGAFSARAEQIGVSLMLEERTEAWVLTDQERFQQVMVNLIGNSLKHTPKGGSITLSVEESAESPDRVRITVSDTGVGIRPDLLEKLFDGSLSAHHHEDHREFGLGLVIAKLIVEQNGGRIWAESRLGRGTKVHFELPKTEPWDGEHGV